MIIILILNQTPFLGKDFKERVNLIPMKMIQSVKCLIYWSKDSMTVETNLKRKTILWITIWAREAKCRQSLKLMIRMNNKRKMIKLIKQDPTMIMKILIWIWIITMTWPSKPHILQVKTDLKYCTHLVENQEKEVLPEIKNKGNLKIRLVYTKKLKRVKMKMRDRENYY